MKDRRASFDVASGLARKRRSMHAPEEFLHALLPLTRNTSYLGMADTLRAESSLDTADSDRMVEVPTFFQD